MKKRRTNPIPLLSVMLLCFVLIGYFNSRGNGDDKNAQQQQQQQAQQQTNVEPSSAVGPPTKAPSKEDLASRLNVGAPVAPGSPGSGPRMPAKPGIRIQGPDGAPGPPPQMHPAKLYKPKPSDSQISGQWYTDETNKTFADH